MYTYSVWLAILSFGKNSQVYTLQTLSKTEEIPRRRPSEVKCLLGRRSCAGKSSQFIVLISQQGNIITVEYKSVMYFSLVFREIRWWFFSSAFFFSFQGPVYRLQWSPFLSDAFLSCSADWSIRLWHQDKPQPIMTFISSTVSLKLKEIQS